MTGPRLEAALRRHTLARTNITGLYGR
jgi:hypothetical protein